MSLSKPETPHIRPQNGSMRMTGKNPDKIASKRRDVTPDSRMLNFWRQHYASQKRQIAPNGCGTPTFTPVSNFFFICKNSLSTLNFPTGKHITHVMRILFILSRSYTNFFT